MPDSLAVPTSCLAPLLEQGDCLELLRRLPAGCVHLIIIDPPYFKVKNEPWDRQWAKPAAFLAWLGTVLDELRRVLAPNGSLYMFASPQMSARVECLTADRFAVLSSIVWVKQAGWHKKAEQAALRCYFPQTERIIFAEQQGSGATGPDATGYEARCEQLRGELFEPLRAYIAGEFERAGMLTAAGKIAANVACGFAPSPGGMAARHYFSKSQWWLPTALHYHALRDLLNQQPGDYLRREYEELRCEYEDLRVSFVAQCREYEHLRRPFSVTADVPYTDVWTYPTVNRYPGKHPCEKPAAMIDDMIRASSRPGDVVLDCFLGSGVTIERSVALGRLGIGFEIGEYIHGARKRIAATAASCA